MSRRVIPGLEPPDATLEAEIRTRLDRVEEALQKALQGTESPLLASTATYLLASGGKRFRPMLALLAGYFGDPTDPRLIPASVSLELVHVATLYHDDVIDEATSRHGVPSANARWDNTVAILTGDWLFAKASEISTELGPEVCRILAQTIGVLCDGQIREVDTARRLDQTQDKYLDVIRRKTAALIATSCRLGGLMSDARPQDVDVLEAFGGSLGLAFQLSDDIMDLTASQLELGKEPGVDLKEGVYTLPVLHALETSPDRKELARILSAGAHGELLDRALEIVTAGGAIEHAREAVRMEVGRAVGLAERLPGGPAQHALVQLARYLGVRCGADDAGPKAR
ncbi:MAG TPA: polyprenyl synthetase family protein [Actinomycetota bacterium]|nr:polyprenyl synthetase family protein [Actinomycetota bacterium]